MAGAFHSLLQEAIAEAAQNGIKKMLEQLEISGEIETKLIIESLNDVGNEALVSVYLFKKGDLAKPSTTLN